MTDSRTPSAVPLRPALPSTLTRRERFVIELSRALEEAAYPSELLNRLQAAVNVNQHALGEVQALFSAAPTLYQVVHGQVLQALGVDPDNLSWTSALRPDAPVTLTLTQVAVESLRDDFSEAGLNQRVSLVGNEGTMGQPVELVPEQVLNHLDSLDLKSRYNKAVRDYWQGIAHGQSVNCCQYVGELRRELIKTQALLAQAAGQLTDDGLESWLQVVAAPTELERQAAGGEAGALQVSEIAWANGYGNGNGVVFKGAFVIHGRDAGQNARELLYVPGMDTELFEFPSRTELLAQMVRWIDSGAGPGWLLWQLLPNHSRTVLYESDNRRPLAELDYYPVTDNIFERSATASVYTQHANELISAVMISPALLTGEATLEPIDASGVALSYAQTTEQWRRDVAGKGLSSEMSAVVAEFVRRDARWHEQDISFGSLAPELALRIRKEKIELHEHSILQLLKPGLVDQDTPQFNEFLTHQQALNNERELSLACLRELASEANLEHADVLTLDSGQGSPQSRLIVSRNLALLLEGQLQVLQQQLTAADFALLTQALKLNLAGHDTTTELRLAAISLGTEQLSYPLVGCFVITSRQGLLTPSLEASTLLFVPGQDGGLLRFNSLAQLREHVGKTLSRRADCSLWLTVALEQQAPARAWVGAVPLRSQVELQLSEITLGIVEYSVKAQIKAHKKTLQAINKFSLVIAGADRQTAMRLLAQTSAMQLQVPGHAAREVALTHVVMQRQAMALKRRLGPWLLAEPNEVQADYARQSRQINENLLAVEEYLFRRLPSVTEFATQKLREQFKHDGFEDDLDPLEDMFSIPDQVQVIKTLGTPNLPSPASFVPSIELAQRPLGMRTYNLVQLALENFDPDDPQMALRLKYLQVLKPEWSSRLTVEYLSRIMPALDIGGAYEQQINLAFYGRAVNEQNHSLQAPGSDLQVQLMARPYRQTLEMDLWLARLQGMDATALALFAHTIRARTPADLKVAQMDIAVGHVTYSSDVERYAMSSVEGVRVIRDTLSDMTLIYMPGTAHGNSLVMYPSLELANAALASMGKSPELLAYLAQRTEPGEDVAQIQDRLAAAANQAPQDWIAAEFKGEVDMGWSLSTDRPERMIKVLRLTSQSTAKRDLLREERNRQQRLTNFFALIGFIPGLNLLSDIYFIDQGFKALRNANSAYEAAQQVLQIGMCLVDMILTFAMLGLEGPQPGKWQNVATHDYVPPRLLMQPFKARQTLAREGWAARAIAPEPKPFVMPDFSGYEIPLVPQDACALTGRYDLGSYRKDGVQFIVQKGKSYRVTRPKNAQTLHLQNPQTQRLGPPVRLAESGEWHFASGYGLPGGVKVAETILMNCGMSLEVAQGLLADYDFPANSGLEHLFAMSVQRDGIRPEWANKFRAVSAEPMAGPSHRPATSRPVTPGLEDYVVPPRVTQAIASSELSMDRVVIGAYDFFVAQGTDADGFYPLYQPDPLDAGQLQVCGRLSPEGIYHLEIPVEMDYISIDGHFYQAHFNENLNRLTIYKPGGGVGDMLVVEPQGIFRRMGEWRLLQSPVEQLVLSTRLDTLARQLMPLPATDLQVARYVSRYGHQLIKATVPELLLARSVPELERLARQHTYRNGLPIETLIRIFEAQINGLPVPEGLPVYDELQGLAPLSLSMRNTLYIHEAVVLGDFLSILPLSTEESVLLANLSTLLNSRTNMMLSTQLPMNQFLRSVLRRKGYVSLGRGNEVMFRRGFFSQIFKSPNGDLYVMTTKLLPPRRTGVGLKPVVLHESRYGVHFSDAWIDSVITSELWELPDNSVAKALREAHERHRLYKLLAGVTREGQVMIFRLLAPGDI